MNDPLDFLDKDLARLDQAGLRRTLVTISSRQGRTVTVNGREVVNFCSNDYLGLAGERRLAEAAIEAIRRYGVGAGASRLMSGSMTLHTDLEARLARFKRTEAAILFITGHAANLGTIPALVGKGDLVASDRLNHASIIDGCRLSGATFRVYPHADVARLEAVLRRGRFSRRLIVSDTVFSMDGDVAPLAELADLAERYGAILMVDEAHATGLLGEGGRGAAEALGVSARVHVQMGTLSKALGALGGYVAGSASLIEFLRQKARSFIYSTAPPVALSAAALAAVEIVETEPERRRRCLDLARRLRTGVSGLGCRVPAAPQSAIESRKSKIGHPAASALLTPIVPVPMGDARRACRAAELLFERGFLIRAVRPPTVPAGTSRLRFSVTAAHTEADVDALVCALGEVLDSQENPS